VSIRVVDPYLSESSFLDKHFEHIIDPFSNFVNSFQVLLADLLQYSHVPVEYVTGNLYSFSTGLVICLKID